MTPGRTAALIITLAVLAILAAGSWLAFDSSSPSISRESRVEAPGAAASSSPANADALIDFWKERVDRNPADYISYAELGGAFIRRARETGDVESYTRAEAAIQESLRLNPDYSTALGYLATIDYSRHDFQSALAIAQRIKLADPTDLQAIAVLGDANLELGNYDEAGAAYELLREKSESAPVLARLARLAELRGATDEASSLLAAAVLDADTEGASTESRAWYRSQLGHVYLRSGNVDAARKQFEDAMRTFPGYIHGLAGLAAVNAALGNYNEAIDLYSEVSSRYPVPEYAGLFGDVLAADGQADRAHQQYQLVLTIDELYRSNGIDTDLQIALFRADHALDTAEAVRQARAEYAVRPSIYAADTLAWALYNTSNYDEALEFSQEALRLGTRDPLLLFHAGMIHQSVGNSREARQYLSDALDINPGFSVLHAGDARETLDRLEAAVAGE
ncbi:MAG: tetratricopeptide repeat protein [Dehalococcoidia bacterium]